jgi:cell division protein FtsW
MAVYGRRRRRATADSVRAGRICSASRGTADEADVVLRAGHVVILCVVALLCLGVVMVTSAGLTIDAEREISVLSILKGRSAFYAGLAIATLIAVSLTPVDRLLTSDRIGPAIAWTLLPVSVFLLLLVYVPGLGRAVNGSHRWVQFTEGVGFQPSEIAKWGLVIILGIFGAGRKADIRRLFRGFLPALLVIGLLCGLVIKEDLGTAVLMGTAAMTLLIAAGARVSHCTILALLGATVCVAAIVSSPYRMDRITAFLNPYEDPQGIGYHTIQSQAAISVGGPAGRGLGHGMHKFGYLPEDTTDFLFAIICEELGAMGAVIVVALYAALIVAAWSIISRETRTAMRLIGLGVLATFGVQAAMNLLVVTGLAPTKGIALPLLSSGGTGWLLGAASLGLIVGMDRRHAQETADDPTTEPLEAPLLANSA